MSPDLFRKIPNWRRGESFNEPISDFEHEVLDNYELEVARGLMHTATWQRRMAQLSDLKEKAEQEEGERAAKCPGGSMSPSDPNFDPDHVFVNGICAQCGARVDR